MGYAITITNTDGKKLRFYDAEVYSSTYAINNKVFKQELPESDTPIVINLGISKTINFPFRLLTTADDMAVGTMTPTTYKTPLNKINYIRSVFITKGITDTYTIEITNDNASITETATFESFSVTLNSEKPNYVDGSFSFSGGGGI
jgi:hypothetical protein